MPQSLSKVIVHITFSTKFRQKFIDEEIQSRLWEYIAGTCRALECTPIKVGGFIDHAHVLCFLSRKITICDFLEEIKKRSSKWIKTIDSKYSDFFWQGGYAVFSVYYKDADVVINYIENQKKHHSKKSFEDEFRELCIENGMEFDERYVWD